MTRRLTPKKGNVAYRCEFRRRRHGTDESTADYRYILRRLSLLAYPEVPYTSVELQIIDQYVTGLSNSDKRKRVTFSHPQTLEQAVSYEVEYEAVEACQNRKPVETSG